MNNLPVESLAKVARSRGVDPPTVAMIRNFISARTGSEQSQNPDS